MNRIALGISATLIATQAFAGRPPAAAVPIVTDLGLLGISVILAGFAARYIARKVKKS